MAIPRARLTRLLLHFRSRGPKLLPQPFSPSSPSSSSSAHGGLSPSRWPTPPSTGGAWPWRRAFHDGRPRGPLWRSKKLIGKEALFAIQGLKRFKGDEEKLADFVRRYVARLLKADKLAVLGELERQEEVDLAVKVFRIIQKEDWYKPDIYMYKDLIISLAKCKKMEEAMVIWGNMRDENLFPDSQTYAEVIRGFLRYGSPSDAMNIYEDMKKSPDPPEELPFRVLLKGLLPHPLLRNRVKQDFEELFPERHIYDPPEEIFGMH